MSYFYIKMYREPGVTMFHVLIYGLQLPLRVDKVKA